MKVEVTLKFEGKEYTYTDTFEHCELHNVQYMYEEGNYSCDCNKSLFIQRYCEPGFLEMDCGDEIELVSLKEITV